MAYLIPPSASELIPQDQYGTHQKEKSKKWKEGSFRSGNWEYDQKEKCYIM